MVGGGYELCSPLYHARQRPLLQEAVGQVQRLVQAHALLCRCAVLVTRRYGVVLPLDVLNVMLHLVILAYYVLTALLLDVRHQTDRLFFFVVSLLLGCLLGRLLQLVRACAASKEEVSYGVDALLLHVDFLAHPSI